MAPTFVRAVAIAVLGIFVLAACSDDDEGTSSGDGERLEVIASFYPVVEAAARVGGHRVRVTNLTPVGVEPHDIELTPRQVDKLEDADIVLYVGQGFQPVVEEIAERRDAGSVDVLEGIDLEEGDVEALKEEAEEHGEEEAEEGSGEEHEESGLDPHFWLNPTLMVEAVQTVVDALTDESPEDAEFFRTNARRYEDELSALDTEFERGLAACDRTEIVTSHAAFFYLADRYGLTQLPIAGLSPEAEPDADRLATLADEIEAKGITTVFYEELVSPRVAETLAREARVDTAVLSPIEGLSREDLDAGKDYAAVMRDNLAELRKALGCR